METLTLEKPLSSEFPIEECMSIPNPNESELEDLDEIIIDDNNFSEYFFDVRYNEPKENQCLARFRSRAEFVDGQLKRDVVHVLLSMAKGGNGAYKAMRKLAGASDRDAIRVPLQMGQDLASGMTVDEVCEKPYEYDCEFFFYADPFNVPFDKKWEIIKLLGNQSQNQYISSDLNLKTGESDLDSGSEDFPGEDYGKSGSIRRLGEQLGKCSEEVGSGGCCESTTSDKV
jgi:hypothetical protein